MNTNRTFSIFLINELPFANQYFAILAPAQMKKKTLSRIFMIASGILAAVIIVFSQSYYQQSELTQKNDSEKKDKSEKVMVSAPSDAVTSNSLVKLSENTAISVPSSFSITEIKSFVKIEKKVFVRFFRTLFRVVISPNAP